MDTRRLAPLLLALSIPSRAAAETPPTSPPAPPSAQPTSPPAPSSAPLAPAADSPAPLAVAGSLFVRFETRRGYSAGGLTGSDYVRYRTRLGLITPWRQGAEGPRVRARVVPQSAGYWHVGGDSLDDPALGLHEGAIEVEAGAVRVEAGRFEMVYGDQLVIGNVGWDPAGRSFDGLRLRWTLPGARPRPAWIDGFFTAVGEGFAETTPLGEDPGAGDTYFTGAYAGLGPLVGDRLDVDGYLLARLFPGFDEGGRALKRAGEVTVGARFAGRAGPVDVRAEAGLQGGTRRVGDRAPKTLAQQIDLEVGLPLAAGRGRVAVEGFYASGDDPDSRTDEGWNHLYPTAHKWLGYMDVIGGRSNVAGGVLHLAAKPAPGWSAAVDGHLFWRPRTATDSRYAGAEVDVGATRTLAAGLTLRGGYGLFLPGDLMGDDPLHFVEVELKHEL